MKYRKTLYLKLILAYLAFGLISFILIATLFSKLTFEHLLNDKAAALYKEATLISTRYADSFYRASLEAEDVRGQLEAIDTFTQAAIWIINPDGELLYNSTDTSVDQENTVEIQSFNPTDTGNDYYMVGKFYNSFDEDVLSVFSPINSNFRVQGYVVMHYSIENIMFQRGTVQCEFNSDQGADCSRKRNESADAQDFPRSVLRRGGQDTPAKQTRGHHLFKTNKAELHEMIITEAFQQDTACTAQQHEKNPEVSFLPPARQEEHQNQKQDQSSDRSNQVGGKIADVIIIGIPYRKKGIRRKAVSGQCTADVKKFKHLFGVPFSCDHQRQRAGYGVQQYPPIFTRNDGADPCSGENPENHGEQAPPAG